MSRTYAQPGEAFTASTVGDTLCPLDDEPVGIHPDLTACPSPVEISGGALVDAIRAAAPGVPVEIAQTGGGCATIFIGAPDSDDRFPLALGPGSYNWSDSRRSVFDLHDLYVGPDDDGASGTDAYPPVRSLDELAAYLRAHLPAVQR